MKKIVEYILATGEITAVHTGPDDMSVSISTEGVGILVIPYYQDHRDKVVIDKTLKDPARS